MIESWFPLCVLSILDSINSSPIQSRGPSEGYRY
jgi:hypothetical protein